MDEKIFIHGLPTRILFGFIHLIFVFEIIYWSIIDFNPYVSFIMALWYVACFYLLIKPFRELEISQDRICIHYLWFYKKSIMINEIVGWENHEFSNDPYVGFFFNCVKSYKIELTKRTMLPIAIIFESLLPKLLTKFNRFIKENDLSIFYMPILEQKIGFIILLICSICFPLTYFLVVQNIILPLSQRIIAFLFMVIFPVTFEAFFIPLSLRKTRLLITKNGITEYKKNGEMQINWSDVNTIKLIIKDYHYFYCIYSGSKLIKINGRIIDRYYGLIQFIINKTKCELQGLVEANPGDLEQPT